MLYVKHENENVTEFPVTEKALRRALPHVTLSEKIKRSELEGTGYDEVPPLPATAIPVQTKDLHLVLRGCHLENGAWVRDYVLETPPPAVQDFRMRKQLATIRHIRDQRMQEFEWRISRHAREVALGVAPTEALRPLHEYMQALADITLADDIFLVEFPTPPALPQ